MKNRFKTLIKIERSQLGNCEAPILGVESATKQTTTTTPRNPAQRRRQAAPDRGPLAGAYFVKPPPWVLGGGYTGKPTVDHNKVLVKHELSRLDVSFEKSEIQDIPVENWHEKKKKYQAQAMSRRARDRSRTTNRHIRKKKTGKKFDSTRGYPGEGPWEFVPCWPGALVEGEGKRYVYDHLVIWDKDGMSMRNEFTLTRYTCIDHKRFHYHRVWVEDSDDEGGFSDDEFVIFHRCPPDASLEFDATKGYPGEGPGATWFRICRAAPCQKYRHYHTERGNEGFKHPAEERKLRNKDTPRPMIQCKISCDACPINRRFHPHKHKEADAIWGECKDCNESRPSDHLGGRPPKTTKRQEIERTLEEERLIEQDLKERLNDLEGEEEEKNDDTVPSNQLIAECVTPTLETPQPDQFNQEELELVSEWLKLTQERLNLHEQLGKSGQDRKHMVPTKGPLLSRPPPELLALKEPEPPDPPPDSPPTIGPLVVETRDLYVKGTGSKGWGEDLFHSFLKLFADPVINYRVDESSSTPQILETEAAVGESFNIWYGRKYKDRVQLTKTGSHRGIDCALARAYPRKYKGEVYPEVITIMMRDREIVNSTLVAVNGNVNSTFGHIIKRRLQMVQRGDRSLWDWMTDMEIARNTIVALQNDKYVWDAGTNEAGASTVMPHFQRGGTVHRTASRNGSHSRSRL